MKLVGKKPKCPVYRFFSKQEYASEFYGGRIRFSLLDNYREIECDYRSDATEGAAKHLHKNNEVMSISGNKHYVLCFSDCASDSSLLQKKFSGENPPPQYIEITNPKKFTEMVLKALRKSGYGKYVGSLGWYQVEYTKGLRRNTQAPDDDIEIFQKPPLKITRKFVHRCCPGKNISETPYKRFSGDEIADLLRRGYLDKTEYNHFSEELEWRLVVTVKIPVGCKHKRRSVPTPFRIGDCGFGEVARETSSPQHLQNERERWKGHIFIQLDHGLKDVARLVR